MPTGGADSFATEARAGNERLRHALDQAGLTGEQLAELVGVDPRSVRRWLSGIIPRARQQAKIAAALNAHRADLWPELAPDPERPADEPGEQVIAYLSASDPYAPNWKGLMRDASEQIDLLAETLAPIIDTPGVPELLSAKAAQDCRTRLLVSRTGRYLEPLLNHPEVEIRTLGGPPKPAILRFDQQLLVTVELLDRDVDQSPVVHIQRSGSRELFERLVADFDELWDADGEPIDPNRDIYEQDDDAADEEIDGDTAGESTIPTPVTPAAEPNTQPSVPPRRWPRRPS